MSATIIAFKRKAAASRDPAPDPRRHVLSNHYHSLLGMNQRQEGLAHKLSWRGGTGDELIKTFMTFVNAGRDFDEALGAYREHLLKALATKCPAAAKRIREGNP
jgi:hypothetical protein